MAELVDTPPEGDDWLHEVKFDGYRTGYQGRRRQLCATVTKRSDLGPPKSGHRHGGDPARQEDNFYTCEICGQKVDMRDLRQAMWHEQPDHEPLEID
ncbi:MULTISPECIES: hypothetical protein [unclassified Mesorhizobium]|uniref:hypothetical protein n=1 Tax=unclassified Mesorhizobium TaxID=325217 RepID=UPI001FEE27B4|nr:MULTISPECIES: hypothetical protein [unclassified Mesorhizobium]